MIELLAILLLFLPGIPLVNLLSKRFNLLLSRIELTLFGCIFWNFLFLILSATFGFYGQARILFFGFSTFSCLLLIIWVVFIIKGVITKRKILLPTIISALKINSFFILALIVIFSFYLVITILHPLYIEWDAVSIYLLSGKSIGLSGFTPLNIFKQSTSDFFLSPGVSIMNGWNYFTLNEPPRILPLIWLSLGALAVYGMCRIKLSKNISFIALTTFLLFPCTIYYMANSSLYLDLPSVVYLIIAFLFIIKALSSGRLPFFALSLMSVCIGVLMKPYAIAFLPLILGLTILALFNKMRSIYKYLLFLPLAFSIFVFQWGWDVMFYSTSSASYLPKLLRILPLLILLPLLFFGIKDLNLKQMIRLKLSAIAVLACCFTPVIIVFGFEILSNHTVFGWGPGASAALKLYQTIVPTSSVASPNIITYISWQPLFLSMALGVSLIIPMSVGLFRTGQNRKNIFFNVMLLWLCISLLTWSFFFSNSYLGSEYRRLLYLAPIVAVLIAVGFDYLTKKLHFDPDVSFKLFIAYISLVTIYSWNFLFSNNLLTSLDSETSISKIAGTELFSVFIVGFLLLLGIAYYMRDHKIKLVLFKGRFSVPIQKVVSGVLVVILLCLALSTSLTYTVETVSQQGSSSVDGYTDAAPPISWLGNNIRQVIDYYNINNLSNSTTIGFRVNYLPYYSNVTVIDMSQVWSYSYLQPLLKEENEIVILNLLYSQNIFYFLIPTSSNPNPSSYSAYQKALNYTLFRMITESSHFSVVKELTDFTLYKLLTESEYNNYINNLKADFSYENNPYILSDDNQSPNYVTNFPNFISLSDDSSSKIIGNNSLKVTFAPYTAEKDVVIRQDLSSSIDASNYSYLSFYFYGQSIGQTYSIRLISSYPSAQFTYQLIDSWTGWARVIIPLKDFTVLIGEPDLSNVTCFAIVSAQRMSSNTMSIGLDRVILDSGNLTSSYMTLPMASFER
jgi:hypothetical protein